MQKLLIFLSVLIACNKQVEKVIGVTPVDESEVLKPVGGYSSDKRSDDYVASLNKGKPVKNQVGNITSLMTTVKSPYQINLNWYGVSGAVKYNVYRNDVFVGSTIQPLFSDVGLTANTKYKYQVAGVASNGVVGNLSNIVYGTTFAAGTGRVVIFLQFNKDTTYGQWMNGFNGGEPLITEGSGFTEQEMQTVTDGIAADYAQFNITVTRNKAEYLAASRRTKTIFTISHEWYSGSPVPTAGGVSYLNTLGLDVPNFVFTSALYYNTYYCIVAGTHEDGHAIGGLHHAIDACDGQSYGGDGNHMGAAYHQTYRFWNYHLVFGCSYEDQITTLNNRTQ